MGKVDAVAVAECGDAKEKSLKMFLAEARQQNEELKKLFEQSRAISLAQADRAQRESDNAIARLKAEVGAHAGEIRSLTEECRAGECGASSQSRAALLAREEINVLKQRLADLAEVCAQATQRAALEKQEEALREEVGLLKTAAYKQEQALREQAREPGANRASKAETSAATAQEQSLLEVRALLERSTEGRERDRVRAAGALEGAEKSLAGLAAKVQDAQREAAEAHEGSAAAEARASSLGASLERSRADLAAGEAARVHLEEEAASRLSSARDDTNQARARGVAAAGAALQKQARRGTLRGGLEALRDAVAAHAARTHRASAIALRGATPGARNAVLAWHALTARAARLRVAVRAILCRAQAVSMRRVLGRWGALTADKANACGAAAARAVAVHARGVGGVFQAWRGAAERAVHGGGGGAGEAAARMAARLVRASLQGVVGAWAEEAARGARRVRLSIRAARLDQRREGVLFASAFKELCVRAAGSRTREGAVIAFAFEELCARAADARHRAAVAASDAAAKRDTEEAEAAAGRAVAAAQEAAGVRVDQARVDAEGQVDAAKVAAQWQVEEAEAGAERRVGEASAAAEGRVAEAEEGRRVEVEAARAECEEGVREAEGRSKAAVEAGKRVVRGAEESRDAAVAEMQGLEKKIRDHEDALAIAQRVNRMHEESMATLESKVAEAELLQTKLTQASEALSLSQMLSGDAIGPFGPIEMLACPPRLFKATVQDLQSEVSKLETRQEEDGSSANVVALERETHGLRRRNSTLQAKMDTIGDACAEMDTKAEALAASETRILAVEQQVSRLREEALAAASAAKGRVAAVCGERQEAERSFLRFRGEVEERARAEEDA
ncbi:hypothetical protein T484DRAFT_1860646 [Baffinella frigidus]|nr:hypothetical protein T484DRAFT_1860646 [Cryptophyta sp. CCMP2293]